MKRIVMLVTAAFLVGGCGETEKPAVDVIRSVRAMKVGDLDGLAGRSFPGRARAAQEVDLAFRVTGPLVAFPVKVGDQVKKDQIVAQIDPRDFEVALRNSQGGLERAKATAKGAQLDYDRLVAARTQSPGSITKRTVDQARENLEVATADISAFEASVDAAADALKYTDLRAPYAGEIVATYAENFENVSSQQMIVRLLDKDQIEFEVGIPETLISMARYIEDIKVTFDAFPDVPVAARVKEIGREASATTRTFPVTMIMDQPESVTILPGMAGRSTGTPRPPGDDAPLKIVIPVTAVVAPVADDQASVWVIDESSNAVSKRAVEISELISAGYVIGSGLEPGDVVATAGANILQEGQVVAPQIQ
jgi:RND family efflux transporter MFP subunit